MKYVKMLISWWLHGWWLLFHHMFGEHEFALRRDLEYVDNAGRHHMVLECVHCGRLTSIDGMISRVDGSISQERAHRLWHKAPRRNLNSVLQFYTDGTVSRV